VPDDLGWELMTGLGDGLQYLYFIAALRDSLDKASAPSLGQRSRSWSGRAEVHYEDY
jgi:hypothetical protein